MPGAAKSNPICLGPPSLAAETVIRSAFSEDTLTLKCAAA